MTIELIQKALEEIARVDPATVTLETKLEDDLGLDSLTVVELAVKLSKKTGINVPMSISRKWKNINDIVFFVEDMQQKITNP